MTDFEENDWTKWSMHVLKLLEKHSEDVEKIYGIVGEIKEDCAATKIEVSKEFLSMKLKVGIVAGGISFGITVIGLAIALYTFWEKLGK